MKKLTTYILCLTCIALLFTGCAKPDPAPGTDPTGQAENTQTTQSTQNTTQTQSTSPTQTDPPALTMPEGTPLTADELAWFNDEFFTSVWVDENENRIFNIRNMFLRVEFATVKEIDLGVLFREGVRANEPVTQEEIDALNQATGSNAPLDVFKIPKWDMEMAFLHNTGVTVDQTQKNGLDKLVYLEQYDAYYNKHGDTAYSLYQMKKGVKLENGTVVILYKNKLSSPADDWIVTLKPHENTYWFVSNLPAK